jgi:DNA repair exonuclease SbcCD ATPase subunit
MSYFINEISIEGFRGINNEGSPLKIKLKPDSVNSIFAANGTGKSSVFEAISYAIHGEITRFTDLPAGENASDYYCNRFHSTRTGTIELSLKPEAVGDLISIRVERRHDGSRHVTSPSGHPTPEVILAGLAETISFLDQRTFLRFIEDTPLNRGRSFASLVGLERLSTMRQALETLANSRTIKTDFEIDALNAKCNNHKQTVARLHQTISDIFEALTGNEYNKDDLNYIDTQTCITLKSNTTLYQLINSEKITEIDFSQLREKVKQIEKSEKRVRLGIIIQAIAALERANGEIKNQEHEEIIAIITERQNALSNTKGPEFHKIHILANSILQTPEWTDADMCPVCLESPDSPVRETVISVLEQYEKIKEYNEALKAAWKRAQIRLDCQILEDISHLELERAARLSNHFDSLFESGNISEAYIADIVNYVTSLESKRISVLDRYKQERITIEAELPASMVDLTRDLEAAAQISAHLINLSTIGEELGLLQSKLDKRLDWQRFIVKAKDTFAAAEVRVSNDKLNSIETQYRFIYEFIMKNEYVIPKLQKSAGSEDLNLRLDNFFGQHNLTALTLLSESYRNALAISIYLAAAINSLPRVRLIILDDVTSSFDAGHQFHLMTLIQQVISRPGDPDGPQVLILSHDGLLQKYFDSSAGSGWHHQRLQGAGPKGMLFTDGFDKSRLKTEATRLITEGQLATSIVYIRQYMEYKLVNIINKVKIPVPLDFAIRDDKKMIRNCLDAIDHSVRLHKSANSLILDDAQVSNLQTTLIPSIIGNWASHYETGALESFSGPMLASVISIIDAFDASFQYTCTCSGGTQIKFYSDLSRKGCRC